MARPPPPVVGPKRRKLAAPAPGILPLGGVLAAMPSPTISKMLATPSPTLRQPLPAPPPMRATAPSKQPLKPSRIKSGGRRGLA
jgi:hypothetical protein